MPSNNNNMKSKQSKQPKNIRNDKIKKQSSKKTSKSKKNQTGGYVNCPSSNSPRIIKPSIGNMSKYFTSGTIDKKGKDSNSYDFDKVTSFGSLNPGMPPYPPVDKCTIM